MTCKNGHLWTPETTRIMVTGVRTCRICLRASHKRGKAFKRKKRGRENELLAMAPMGKMDRREFQIHSPKPK